MSKRAERALSRIGRQDLGAATKDISKHMQQANLVMSESHTELAAALSKVTSATQKYNEVTKATLTTVKGYDWSGRKTTISYLTKGDKTTLKEHSTSTDAPDLKQVKAVEAAYRRLMQSQREYLSALKAGNEGRQAYWQAEIDGSQSALHAASQSA